MATDKVKQLEKKLKVLEKKPDTGTTGKKKVDLLNELASILSSQPIVCEKYTKKALDIAKCIDYKKGIATAYQRLGWCFFSKSNYLQALQYYKESQHLCENINDRQGNARCCKSIGMVYGVQSNYKKAFDYFNRALEICKHISNKTVKKYIMAHVHSEIGGLYYYLNDYVKQLKHLHLAQKTFEQIDNKEGLIVTNTNISAVYGAQNETKQALKYLLSALRLSKEINAEFQMVYVLNNIGSAYGRQRKYDKALKHFTKSLKIAKSIGHKEGAGTALYGIARCYIEKDAYKEALRYLNEMLENPDTCERQLFLCMTYNLAGNLQTKLRHYNIARRYLDKSLNIAKKISSKSSILENYRDYSDLYIAQKKYRQALNFYKKCVDLEKEILDQEKNKQITEMRTRYETDRKEKEAEISHLKNIELRKEIKERKRIEKELKKHRAQLEDTIDKRTAELKKELAKRRRVENELLKHQNQLRALNRALSIVEEKQRRRTANYLHDHISQALSLTIMKIRELQENSSAKDTKKALAEIKNMVAQTNQRTRSLTFEISPPILYELGLEPAVEWLVGQYQKQHGISYTFKDDGSSKPLKDDARILLFQAVRELLNNAAKHAQAQNVRISTCKDNNSIRIAVEDDGIGFNPEDMGLKITHNEGFGLFNIRERLHCLGGKIEIDSNKGKGTSVVLMVPLKRTRKKTKRKRR